MKKGKYLGDYQHFVSVKPVCDTARKRRDQEGRKSAGKTDETEHKSGVGKAVDQPAHGDHLYPGTDK